MAGWRWPLGSPCLGAPTDFMDSYREAYLMSTLQPALVASGAVVALVLAFATFRLAATAAMPNGRCWAAAGAAVAAWAVDLAAVFGTLGLPAQSPDQVRIAWTVFGVLCAIGVAVFAYAVNGPAPAPVGTAAPAPESVRALRAFAAGGALTGALSVMGVVALLLG
ncbi:hypothetical protein ACIGW4_33500 [Streptomyces sp. NPDC053513]|uniref:hypothetical protein n=1 Tax=unclassified Streptomyces TaxID=2593676 RepID=UPI0037D29DD9